MKYSYHCPYDGPIVKFLKVYYFSWRRIDFFIINKNTINIFLTKIKMNKETQKSQCNWLVSSYK